MVVYSFTKEVGLAGDKVLRVPLSASKHTIAVEAVDGGSGTVIVKTVHSGLSTPQNFDGNEIDLSDPKAIVVEGALMGIEINNPATVNVSVVGLR